MNITIWVNGQARETDSSLSLAVYLIELGYKDKKIAAELNEEIIPASLHGEIFFQENDRLEIVQAIGGG